MKRMLADVCPELINEWSQRNLPLTPDSVTHGSNKIVKVLLRNRRKCVGSCYLMRTTTYGVSF